MFRITVPACIHPASYSSLCPRIAGEVGSICHMAPGRTALKAQLRKRASFLRRLRADRVLLENGGASFLTALGQLSHHILDYIGSDCVRWPALRCWLT